MKPILDACCGSRMFWFDREREGVVFMDARAEEHVLCDGRKLTIAPDVVGDFRKMDFEDASFRMVVFDPPHLLRAGENGWQRKKYGCLNRETWREDIRQGFAECFRVLELGGFLIFKWNEEQVRLGEVLQLAPCRPLFGHQRGKTHFVVFTKEEQA